jgi:hypothetical protein
MPDRAENDSAIVRCHARVVPLRTPTPGERRHRSLARRSIGYPPNCFTSAEPDSVPQLCRHTAEPPRSITVSPMLT